MATKKKTVDVIGKLYSKLGRVSYVLAQAEATVRQAQQAHQQLQKQAVDLANEIAQAEKKKTGD